MHVPITIPLGVLKVYSPSKLTTSSISEQGRTVFAENFEMGEVGPSCARLCLNVLSDHLAKNPDQIVAIDEMECKERDYLIESLPLDLPLQNVLDMIPDDYYWRKYSKNRWPESVQDKSQVENWRTYYLRRHITEYIQSQMPELYDVDDIHNTCTQVADYIYDLDIKELRPSQPIPGPEEDPEAPMIYPADHFNLSLALQHFPHLQSLRVRFGSKKLGHNFAWHLMKVSVEDCRKLGEGICLLPGLRKLSLHRSFIGDDQLQPLLQALITYQPLEELDVSYCQIGDRGGLMLGKLLSMHPSLKILRVPGNDIGELGAHGIAYGIKQDTSCPLDFLDLRLNPLGDDGALLLFCGLIRVKKPRILGIAGISMHGEGGIRVAEAMLYQKSLQEIDVSSNFLGTEGGDWLISSLDGNLMMLRMDCRNTDITEEQLSIVEECLLRNRKRGPPSLSSMKLQDDQVICRQFSFPVTDSEILLQDAKDSEWAMLMTKLVEESSEDEDIEVVVIKEYDGNNHEEEEDGLLGYSYSSKSS